MGTNKATHKAAKKAAKKGTRKAGPAHKGQQAAGEYVAAKSSGKARAKRPASQAAKSGRNQAASAKAQSTKAGNGGNGAAQGQLRVRMYRIGFGDFFLLTVPT